MSKTESRSRADEKHNRDDGSSRKRRKSPEESPKKRSRKTDGDEDRHHDSSSSRRDRDRGGKDDGSRRVKQEHPKSKELITEELKNKEIVYQAKMQIQERIKELGLASSAGSINREISALKPEEASAFIDLHMDKVSRLAEAKNRLSKNLSNINLKTPSIVLEELAVEKQEKKPKIEPKEEPRMKQEPDLIEYLDPRIKLKPTARQRRTFDFKAPGDYEKLANQQRSKARLEKLQSEISKTAKQTGISSAVKLAIVTPSGTELTEGYIPSVEWWDEVVLGNGKGYDDKPSLDVAPIDRYSHSITDLVEHPIQLKPPDESMQPQFIKACLTAKERKKLRRQNRREAMREKVEKVRLGLEKPPEPKVKISNLMRVLGNEAIQDPTKMEAHVRKQIQERAQKHIDANESRKLTRDQKRAKSIRKLAEDTSLAVHVAVYKIKSLTNPAKKFKVMMNAKQYQLTGVFILLEDINVVVVEGGPKQQKKFKNLMLNRIKWAEEIIGQKGRDKSANNPPESSAAAAAATGEKGPGNTGQHNECVLIWEGVVQKRAFNGEPRYIIAPNHKHAREVLEKHGVPHYWDLCYSTSVLLSSDE